MHLPVKAHFEARMSLQAAPTRNISCGSAAKKQRLFIPLSLGLVRAVTLIHDDVCEYNAGFLFTFPFAQPRDTLPVLMLLWAVAQELSLISHT